MPSCVVKCCRNHSGVKKKTQGITFHRFPRGDESWKNNLIKIIRDCRRENNWIPSKTSVICSTHFESTDLYTTQGRLVRMVTNALPKKFLFEPPPVLEENILAANTCNAFQELTAEASNELVQEEHLSISNSPPEPLALRQNASTSTPLPIPQLMVEASIELVQEEHLSKSNSPPESLTLRQNPGTCTPLPVPQNFDASKMEIDLEQPLSVLYTPRKQRLKKSLIEKDNIIKNLRQKLKVSKQKVRRLQSRNKSLKYILKTLKDKNFVDTDLYGKLSEDIIAVDVFNNYNRKKLKKNVKYSPAIKKFCLTLNYYSPKAYDYVRETFNTCLPHRKTLCKWYGNLKGDPGFTEESFQASKAKAQVSQHRPLCSLLFDEVAIRPQPIWEGKKNIGLVDMGTGVQEGAPLASQALVFLLVGINERFKLPLGYFFGNSFSGEQKANLIKLCLTKCFESDTEVVSLTCDGHSTNFNALRLLGCSFEPESLKTTFPHPSNNSEVAFFLDPSHVMKLLRNTWQSKQTIMDGNDNKIDWLLLEKLNNQQNEEGLHLANKLTLKHVHFKNYIMKVKLATQVFSTSVAIALKTCREILQLDAFQHSESTETFIKKMNDMFDISNSRNMAQFDFKKPICSQNKDKIFAFLEELKDYVLKLKIKHMTKRKVKINGRITYVITRYNQPIVKAKCKTGFLGILINTESLKYLYEKIIHTENKLIYLPTYKLSQDHLEMFFSSIRLRGGFNDNPNVKQFKGNYKKLLAHLEIRCLTTGNCVPLEQIAILHCTSSSQIINTTTPSYRHIDEGHESCESLAFLNEITKEDDDLARRLDIQEINDYRKLIIGYLAGSIAHYAAKRIKCQNCMTRLCTGERLFFHRLINLKTRGGLHYPSKDLYEVCCICEMIVRKVSKENISLYSDRQHEYILTKIQEKFIESDKVFLNLESEHTYCGIEHKINLIKYIAEKYLTIRFHYISKSTCIARTMKSKRQVFKKLLQQTGY